MQAKLYNQSAEIIGDVDLPDRIFGVAMNAELLKQALDAQFANSRQVLAHTKDRAQVRGGGRKPWKQKGTGRARHGSIRSPIWIGGGITFGPRSNRNFTLKINHKVRRRALLMSLSAKVAEAALMVVDDVKPVGKKSKQAAQLLVNLKLRAGKKGVAAGKPAKETPSKISPATNAKPAVKPAWPSVLVALPPKSDEQVLAFRNLRRVALVSDDSLNVQAVLGNRYLVLSLAGLDRLIKQYGGAKAKSA